jgi:hypothetical protein
MSKQHVGGNADPLLLYMYSVVLSRTERGTVRINNCYGTCEASSHAEALRIAVDDSEAITKEKIGHGYAVVASEAFLMTMQQLQRGLDLMADAGVAKHIKAQCSKNIISQ